MLLLAYEVQLIDTLQKLIYFGRIREPHFIELRYH